MINKEQISKIVNRRPRRDFGLEDKQRFYALWKNSGLTKTRFCKEQDLVLSSFIQWCRALSSSEKNACSSQQNDWLPVIAKRNNPRLKEPMILEIKTSNSIRIYFILLFIFLFSREIYHAINTLW